MQRYGVFVLLDGAHAYQFLGCTSHQIRGFQLIRITGQQPDLIQCQVCKLIRQNAVFIKCPAENL